MGDVYDINTRRKRTAPTAAADRPTTVAYHDGGKGLVTMRCGYCDGDGRVYEGGYGMRDCPECT